MSATPPGAPTACDVAIVGAGPAGAVAAVAARAVAPHLRVLLLDRAGFPRDKCCGDGIAAQAVEVLATLGIADVVDGWRPLRHLQLAAGADVVASPMAREVHVIPRRVLDARLVEHAQRAGAQLVRRRVAHVEPPPAEEPERPVGLDDAVTARVTVGADGAHSRVRAALTGRHDLPTPRRALALRGYAPTPPERRGQQVIRYGPGAQPSYAWAFDRGDGLSNVGYGALVPAPAGGPPRDAHGGRLSRAGMLAQLEALLPGTVDVGGDWLGHPLPLSGWRWSQPDGPCLLAGDAAGLVNPMTGEGIYYAVATGAIAGRVAAESVIAGRPDRAGARYRAEVRALLGTHLRHTATAGLLSQHQRVVAAGIGAARRDGRVFDDLVEIGLGAGRITPRLARGLATELVRRRPAPETGTVSTR